MDYPWPWASAEMPRAISGGGMLIGMTMVDDAAIADGRREDALRRYDVPNLRPRRQLQALVDLAALVCEVPMAAINLVGARDQHRVATVGILPEICSRDGTMCSTSMFERDPVVVPDARLDSRFRDNAFVNGERADLRFYASHQLRTPEGVVIGTLCVFDGQPRDLTEEQFHALGTLAERVVDVLELELTSRQVAEANERLASSNERLAAFVGQVSHDLNNPLNAITMALELASDEAQALPTPAQDPFVGLLDRASRGAGRMHAMVMGLLDFAQSGRSAHRTPVDVAEIVEMVREDLGHLMYRADLHVGDLPTLAADPVQLRVLLQNLIGNALKFSGAQDRPVIAVRAARRGEGWRVEIADNGPGIRPEDRDRVFEIFTRTDDALPGTGIGLSTCQRIVQAHGGSIGIDAAPEGGTLVWFELPDPPTD